MYKYIRLEVRWLCEYDLWNLLGVRKKIWGLMEIGRNEIVIKRIELLFNYI